MKSCRLAANDPKCPGEKGLFALADYMMSGNDIRQITASSLKDCYLKCFSTSGCKV